MDRADIYHGRKVKNLSDVQIQKMLVKKEVDLYRLSVLEIDKKINLKEKNDASLVNSLEAAEKILNENRFIEDVHLIKRLPQPPFDQNLEEEDFDIGLVNITWVDGVSIKIAVADADEFVKAVGAHLTFWKVRLAMQMRLINEAISRMRTPYDSNNPDHEKQLLKLWKISFPETELSGRISTHWGKLGFQGKDPATDFRGGGIFALECLLYFAEHHNSLLYSMTRRTYPFATTSIHISIKTLKHLASLDEKALRLRKDLSFDSRILKLFCVNNDVNSVFKLYFAIFIIFDRIWKYENAEYLDAPAIFDRTDEVFLSILRAEPMTFEELQRMAEGLYLEMNYAVWD